MERFPALYESVEYPLNVETMTYAVWTGTQYLNNNNAETFIISIRI